MTVCEVAIMPLQDIGLYIVAGVGATTVVTLLGWSWQEIVRAHRSKEWPTCAGEIVHSRVAERCDEGCRMYSADVRYRYAIGGRELVCDRIGFGGSKEASWPGPAERIVQRYPAGQRVMVHVSPDDPRLAVLEAGTRSDTYYLFVIAVAVTAATLGFLVVRWLGR
jgi:hypothetical protein